MVAYPHWLDHRILGTMAGDIRWPNGLVTREELIGRMRANAGTRYAYDPDRPLFVMFHAQDAETEAYLEDVLPGGTVEIWSNMRMIPRAGRRPGHSTSTGFGRAAWKHWPGEDWPPRACIG